MAEKIPSTLRSTFPKPERLHSKKVIEELFNKGSYFYLYPFKVIYREIDDSTDPQILFSVSKRKFKSAVDRNRVKRLLREAYRLNKHTSQIGMRAVAFIYTSDDLPNFSFIEKKVTKALKKLSGI